MCGCVDGRLDETRLKREDWKSGIVEKWELCDALMLSFLRSRRLRLNTRWNQPSRSSIVDLLP